MLMPAAVLVLLLLAALAVDASLTWTAQRELANRAAAAANDIAATALDERGFYGSGTVALDPAKVDRILADHLAAEPGGLLDDLVVNRVEVDGRQVRVSLAGRARAIFGPAVRPANPRRVVSATAVAEAVAFR